MKTKRREWLFAAATLLVAAPAVLAKAAYIPLPEKVQQCELIARVSVVSTRSLGGKEVEGYGSEAKVKLLEVLKGPAATREITLAFDNGLGCPNVHYKAGEVVLVFLKREKSGRYSTFNTYFGKVEPTPKAMDEVRTLVDGGRLKRP